MVRTGGDMTEAQVRYRLKRLRYTLRTRNGGFMIVDSERNFVVAGGEGGGFNLTLYEVVDFFDG